MVISRATTIRNQNTRAAYHRAVRHFFAWLEEHGIDELVAIEPLHVAAYIEALLVRSPHPFRRDRLPVSRWVPPKLLAELVFT